MSLGVMSGGTRKKALFSTDKSSASTVWLWIFGKDLSKSLIFEAWCTVWRCCTIDTCTHEIYGFYVCLVIDCLEMLFVWWSEEGNFLDWIQRFFVCFGEVVVGTLASLDGSILWGFVCCIEICRPVNGEYRYCESCYHTVSISNTETECRVHLLPQLTLNEHKYKECSYFSDHKDSCAVIDSSELCMCCGII